MPYERFVVREGDFKQQFLAVWDQNLVPREIETPNYEMLYEHMKFTLDQTDQNMSIAVDSMAILESIEKENTTLQLFAKRCVSVLGDVFSFYMASQNYQELLNLYTRLICVRFHEMNNPIADTPFSLAQIDQTINSISVASLKLFWFGAT
jgi:hypothetical protein